jgi:DNA-binding XRE family transcriptional regulator
MPAGAPSKFKPAYCDEVITHCSDGASLLSFAAEIGVARSTIQQWEIDHPEFSVAVKIAKAKCAAWWERVNRHNAQTNQGNATSCIFGLKNMGADDWRDRKETDITTGGEKLSSGFDMSKLSAEALRELAKVKLGASDGN